MHRNFWSEIAKERRLLEGLGVDGRMILEWILQKWVGRVWTGFTWLMIGFSGGLL
jgi:hypothetical protein